MNRNYERCTYCNRRKWLTSGCLRKWIKPTECKHLPCSTDGKRNSDKTDSALLSDRKSINTNKFVKFWRNKVFISGSIRCLQRYFNSNVDNVYKMEESVSSSQPNTPMLNIMNEPRKDLTKNLQSKPIKCPHSDCQVLHRGNKSSESFECCAIYCQLSKHGWYWGSISSSEAEALLAGQHDNVFLVRDSYDFRHILCVSFRCVGRTLHARLRHANGLFSLNNKIFVPPNNISEHCSTVTVQSNFLKLPVKLASPLNRFARLDSLQMICRYVIRQTFSTNTWNVLPLPPELINYISLGTDYISHT